MIGELARVCFLYLAIWLEGTYWLVQGDPFIVFMRRMEFLSMCSSVVMGNKLQVLHSKARTCRYQYHAVPVVPEKMAGETGFVLGICCGTVGFDYYE